MGSRDNPPLDRILAEIQPSNKTFSKENGRSVEFEDCSARVFFRAFVFVIGFVFGIGFFDIDNRHQQI